MMVDFGLNFAQIGLISAAGTLTTGLLQAGVVSLRRYLPRNFVMGIGSTLYAAATSMIGLATSFPQLIAFALLGGAGSSSQHPVGASLLSDHFGKTKGMALGVHYASGNVGFVVGPILATLLLTLVGWRNTFFVFAVPGVLVGLTYLLAIRDEPISGDRGNPRQLSRPLAQILLEKNILLLIGIEFILSLRLGAILTYVPLYFKTGLGLDQASAGFLFALLLSGTVVGPFLFGYLSDRIGRRPVGFTTIGASAALMYLLTIFKRNSPELLTVLVLLGLTLFSVSSILQAALADYTEPSARDKVFGIFFTLGFGMGSIWASGTGIIIDRYGFDAAFTTMAAFTLIATAMIAQISQKKL